MIAPEACRPLPLKSASVMELSIVTGLLLYLSSPLKVNFTNALMAGMDGAVWEVPAVLAECITQAPFDTAWLHLLALGDDSCNLLGALSLEFILRHV